MELIHEIFFGSFLAKASTNKPVFGAIGATLVFMKQPKIQLIKIRCTKTLNLYLNNRNNETSSGIATTTTTTTRIYISATLFIPESIALMWFFPT